jgi:hypothetical protein
VTFAEVDRLGVSSAEMHRNLRTVTLELPLVERAQPRDEVGQDRRRFVLARREGGGTARLVVVLEKARRAPLEFRVSVPASGSRGKTRDVEGANNLLMRFAIACEFDPEGRRK